MEGRTAGINTRYIEPMFAIWTTVCNSSSWVIWLAPADMPKVRAKGTATPKINGIAIRE
jgi:hypothetical protein